MQDQKQPDASRQPRLAYRVKEFCEAVGISRPTFYARVKEGKISTFKIGARTLVSASEVERILRGEAA